MVVNGSELYKFLDTIFLAHAFRRKKDTWYFHTNECICFFHTAKSPYSGQFDHVMGCFVKKVYGSEEEFPKFNKANLKSSLRMLTDEDFVQKTFDLEDAPFKDMQREARLKDLIEQYAIPFLLGVSTEEGIRKSVKTMTGLVKRVDLKTRKALGIEA
jgi:hypothetical protein